MYIASYAETNWDDDRLIHLPTAINKLKQKISDLEWEGIDVSSHIRELNTLIKHLEESTSEFYPKF